MPYTPHLSTADFIRRKITQNMPQKPSIGPAPGGLGAEGAGEDQNEAMEPAPEAMEPAGQPEPPAAPNQFAGPPADPYDPIAAAGKVAGGMANAGMRALPVPPGLQPQGPSPQEEQTFQNQMHGADDFMAKHQANMAQQQAMLQQIQQNAQGGQPTAADMEQLQSLMHPGGGDPSQQQRVALAQTMMKQQAPGGR